MATAVAHFELAQQQSGLPYEDQVQEMTRVITTRKNFFHLIALRRLGNPADAEDAVQDAFLSAYQHLGQFKGQAQMSTWLTAIVINSTRMKVRRHRPHQMNVSIDQQERDENDFSFADKLADGRPGPEDICRERELAKLLSHSSNRLTPILRKTLELREVEGLSIRETAQALGLREGTVKARAARARAGLKKMMQGSIRREPLAS